ncbi:MAG: hypothetical protein RJA57_1334 [Bacteroidota bacterium]|jgi:TrmH family RNA methyltransferase
MLSKSTLKYIQSLGQKKFRQAEQRFLAEGPKVVLEFLRTAPEQVRAVYALPEWLDAHRDQLRGLESGPVTPQELERLTQLTVPNQVLAVVAMFGDTAFPDPKAGLTLALDAIQDPGNMGTIIRTADWFGITQIVCSPECADRYNPKVVQATMGSLTRVSLHYCDLETWLSALSDVRIYAAVLDGRDVSRMEKVRDGVLLVGNESRGLRAELIQRAGVRITIPRRGEAESLNAAVATGIILSHLC